MFDKYLVDNFVAFLIVGGNSFLKYISVVLIDKIGYSRKSEVISLTISAAFYSQFVNSAVILLLSYANFEDTPLSFIPMRNAYKDFDE